MSAMPVSINYFILLCRDIDTTVIVFHSYKDMYHAVCRDSVLNIGLVLMPQPNKTKPPLQDLAVVEGNSEKIRVEGPRHMMGE